MSDQQESGALTVREDEETMPTLPTNAAQLAKPGDPYALATFGEAWRHAQIIARSGLYPRLNTAAKVFTVMAMGSEFNLTPMQAVRGITLTDHGTIAILSALKEALVRRVPGYEYLRIKVLTNDKCVVTAKRQGQDAMDFEFTMDDARRAGLVDRGQDPKKNNWNKYPKRMLFRRAIADACEMYFGDAMWGLPDEDEALEIEATVVEAAQQPVVQQIDRSTNKETAATATRTRRPRGSVVQEVAASVPAEPPPAEAAPNEPPPNEAAPATTLTALEATEDMAPAAPSSAAPQEPQQQTLPVAEPKPAPAPAKTEVLKDPTLRDDLKVLVVRSGDKLVHVSGNTGTVLNVERRGDAQAVEVLWSGAPEPQNYSAREWEIACRTPLLSIDLRTPQLEKAREILAQATAAARETEPKSEAPAKAPWEEDMWACLSEKDNGRADKNAIAVGKTAMSAGVDKGEVAKVYREVRKAIFARKAG